MNQADLTARAGRLDELARGLAKEVTLVKARRRLEQQKGERPA